MYHNPFTTPSWYPEGFPIPLDMPPGYPGPPTLIPKQECLDETIPHDPVNSEPATSTPVQGPPFYPPQMFQPFPFQFYHPYMQIMPPEAATPVSSPYYGPPFPSIPPIQPPTPKSEDEKKKSATHLRVKKFTPDILAQLNMKYQENNFIQGAERRLFAEFLGLKTDQVKIWFQNKRYKDRKLGKLMGAQKAVQESPYPEPANRE